MFFVMKCFLPNFPSEKVNKLMRWFGYAEHRESDNSMSFVRSPLLPEARWPRFHVSVWPRDGGVQINIHLDQEDARGQGNHQFVWAYHNLLVMDEVKRFESLIDKARTKFIKPTFSIFSPVKSTPSRSKFYSWSKKIFTFLFRQKNMQTFINGPLSDNSRNLMRRFGYGEHIGHGEQISFTRRLAGSDFPRFHAYVEDQNGGMKINLHLDQKSSNLGSGAMHGGEYEGSMIADEMRRLKRMIESTSSEPKESEEPEEKKGFWGSVFG